MILSDFKNINTKILGEYSTETYNDEITNSHQVLTRNPIFAYVYQRYNSLHVVHTCTLKSGTIIKYNL